MLTLILAFNIHLNTYLNTHLNTCLNTNLNQLGFRCDKISNLNLGWVANLMWILGSDKLQGVQ